jgi:hypothetical protein
MAAQASGYKSETLNESKSFKMGYCYLLGDQA